MKQHPVWNAFSHATVIGSAMFLIFLCIDRVNPAMDFLSSNLSKWCLLAYCVMSLITALCAAVYLFKRSKSALKHHPSHRKVEAEPVRHDVRQAPYRSLNYANAARNTVSGGDPRDASIIWEREVRHDARYERGR